jgi:hypothetical protein
MSAVLVCLNITNLLSLHYCISTVASSDLQWYLTWNVANETVLRRLIGPHLILPFYTSIGILNYLPDCVVILCFCVRIFRILQTVSIIL